MININHSIYNCRSFNYKTTTYKSDPLDTIILNPNRESIFHLVAACKSIVIKAVPSEHFPVV
jgi:hypothetical protein